jgi:hypothetical protein
MGRRRDDNPAAIDGPPKFVVAADTNQWARAERGWFSRRWVRGSGSAVRNGLASLIYMDMAGEHRYGCGRRENQPASGVAGTSTDAKRAVGDGPRDAMALVGPDHISLRHRGGTAGTRRIKESLTNAPAVARSQTRIPTQQH